MATTFTGTGDFSDGVRWSSGAPPANNETWEIAAGAVCTYDYDNSLYADGFGIGTINGTLKVKTNARSYMKIKGNIIGTGSYYCGESTDPVQVLGDGNPNTHTFFANGNYYFNSALANAEIWGEQRELATTLAAEAANGTKTLVLTDALTLRAGDVLAVAHPTVGANASYHTVETWTAGTKTATVTEAIATTRPAGYGVTIRSATILFKGVVASTQYLFAQKDNGIIRGARFETFLYAPIRNRNGWDIRYCISNNNANSGICRDCTNCTIISCTGNNNNSGGICYLCTNCTITSCTGNNNVNGGICNTCYNCTIISCTGNNNNGGGICYNCTNCTITSCTGNNNVNGGICHTCYNCTITSCTGNNNVNGGICYACTNCTYKNSNLGTAPQGTINRSRGVEKFFNCHFDTLENSGYNSIAYSGKNQFIPSFDHDQSAGAFRSWTLGGITDKVSDVYPAGEDHSYRLTCESAVYFGFYQEIYRLAPGDKLDLVIKVKCNDATPTDGPDITVFLANEADPLMFGTTLVYSGSLSVGADTWETFTVPRYTNSLTYDVELVARVACMDATAQVWTHIEATPQYTDPGKANVVVGNNYRAAGITQVAEFDESARNTDPGIANVKDGTTYVIQNVNKTGTLVSGSSSPDSIIQLRRGRVF